MKIHCIESQKKEFDNISMEEVRKMIGWIEPPEKENGTWDVVLADGNGFECKDQATAQILASIEEIKALLINLVKKA